MKILVSGATGFVGSALVEKLLENGHSVVGLSRDPKRAEKKFSGRVPFLKWNPGSDIPDAKAFSQIQAVIHLAGESILSGRWSDSVKKQIYDSRVMGTRELMLALKDAPLKVILSTSAIGYYGDRADEVLSEASSSGPDFLARVCRDWEKEVFDSGFTTVRKVVFRVGVVLGKKGGALAKMLPPFRAGLGGPIGSGRQWMSWVALEDVVSAFLFALENQGLQGPVNLVSPEPVTNLEFTRTLANALSRPAFFRVPAFVIKVGLGEASQVLLGSQRVLPKKLIDAGFQFNAPDIGKGIKTAI